MEVLMKTGAYNGEIRNVKPLHAQQMLRDGRAILPVAVRGVDVEQKPVATPKKAAVKRTGNRP